MGNSEGESLFHWSWEAVQMTWLLVHLLKVVVLCIEIFTLIRMHRLEPCKAGGHGDRPAYK